MPVPDQPDARPTLVDRGFGDDTGAADTAVAAALRVYADDERGYAAALQAIASSRLLLPVVSVTPEQLPPPAHTHDHETEGHDQHEHDDDADVMAAVSIQRPDGRKGLLAFTCVESQSRWNAVARPLPVTAQQAADTAVRDGATALVVDIAGPVRFVIEGEDLIGVAGGWSLGRVGGRSVWIRPSAE